MPEKDKPNKITMFAYGTNISQEQMLSHCPNAVLLGYGTLLNYELKFQGFRKHAIANLVKKRGAELPIAVYELEPEGRFTIDNYEKFPYNYAKKKERGRRPCWGKGLWVRCRIQCSRRPCFLCCRIPFWKYLSIFLDRYFIFSRR